MNSQDLEPGVSQPQAVPPAVNLARELIATIMQRRQEKFQSNIKPKPRKSIWASQFSECERQMAYEFLHWEEKKLHDWKLEALFEAGREEELAFKAQLSDLGRRSHPQFELVEDGAPLSKDLSEKYGIHGALDTRIKWGGKRIPVEMKLMSQFIFDKIDGIQLDNPEEITMELIERGINSMKRFPWTYKYLKQGQIYQLGTNEEVLIFALTDGRGAWKFVIQQLDYSFAESLLKTAERVKAAVESKTLPERIAFDPDICGRCAFAHLCIPDIKADPRVKLVDNKEMGELLTRREALQEKKSEFDKIDKKIKAFFSDVKEGVFTIGDFVVVRKGTPTTKYDIPDDVKAKYARKEDVFKNKIERFMQPDPAAIYLEPRRVIGFSDDSVD
jgi:CRISPR/Cas system-associated exonuclease Cas4 (RecB family)